MIGILEFLYVTRYLVIGVLFLFVVYVLISWIERDVRRERRRRLEKAQETFKQVQEDAKSIKTTDLTSVREAQVKIKRTLKAAKQMES